MIGATCHSDDRVIEVDFDATKWFEEATDEDILELSDCGWGGDYPADSVAIFMADHNPEIESMFRYLEYISQRLSKEDESGFECHVDDADAKAWIKTNRPQLATKLVD